MAGLFVKIAYLMCSLLIKKSTRLFCIERFLYLSSIYTYLGCLVVWYLKRWSGFDSQPGLVLSTVNSFQSKIPLFNFYSSIYIFAINFLKESFTNQSLGVSGYSINRTRIAEKLKTSAMILPVLMKCCQDWNMYLVLSCI